MTPPPRLLLIAIAGTTAALALGPAAAMPAHAAAPPWVWPVDGEVGEPYRAPPTPYAAGHRGIDISAAAGTPVLAPADGVVTFSGPVGGRPVLAILHADGITSTFDPVLASTAPGQLVAQGAVVGVVAPTAGHCPADCLHLGARVAGRYLSPLALLSEIPGAVLLPLLP